LEGNRDLFWRLLVVIVLLVALATHRGISPDEFLVLRSSDGAGP
jgi:hypothetical protein